MEEHRDEKGDRQRKGANMIATGTKNKRKRYTER